MEEQYHLNRRRLYQQMADEIEKKILDGVLIAGEKLPSENELAEKYDVSRNVVREALKCLKEHGLVRIQTGKGTYVSQVTTKPISQALGRLFLANSDKYSVSHFYEVRCMLEPACSKLAAERATQDDIDRITATITKMEINQNDNVGWSNADLDFHLTIAISAHNPLVLSIMEPLTDSFRKVISVGHEDPLGSHYGLEAHHQILKAIIKRDPNSAERHMLEHLIDSQARVMKIGLV